MYSASDTDDLDFEFLSRSFRSTSRQTRRSTGRDHGDRRSRLHEDDTDFFRHYSNDMDTVQPGVEADNRQIWDKTDVYGDG